MKHQLHATRPGCLEVNKCLKKIILHGKSKKEIAPDIPTPKDIVNGIYQGKQDQSSTTDRLCTLEENMLNVLRKLDEINAINTSGNGYVREMKKS